MSTAKRIALVTGGNKGIGLELSRNLSAAGCTAGNFLHRFDAGDHGLVAPGIEEFGSPCGGVILP